MITTNFSFISDMIGIVYKGNHMDLHNNYKAVDFTHDIEAEKAEISFRKGTGDWIGEDELEGFSVLFEHVSAVYTKAHDDDYPRDYLAHDGGTINLMGFMYGGGGAEEMTGVSSHEPDPELPSVIFVFVTGKAIKVTAEKATLISHHESDAIAA